MTTFFAKIETESQNSIFRTVNSVRTYGQNQQDAEKNVERLILYWNDVKKYRILKISNFPITINKYIFVSILKFNSGSTKKKKVTIHEETEEEAFKRFHETINRWKIVVSVEVKEVIHA